MNALLTVEEAAERLSVSVVTMRRLIWASEIDYVDLNKGGRYIKARFAEEHIAEYLEKNEVKAG